MKFLVVGTLKKFGVVGAAKIVGTVSFRLDLYQVMNLFFKNKKKLKEEESNVRFFYIFLKL